MTEPGSGDRASAGAGASSAALARSAAHAPPDEEDGVPAVVSARRYLRDAMPSIYRDPNGFAMRFLHALERMLDPRVAIVESLSAYLSPRMAPAAMIDAMGDWLGLGLRDAPPEIPRRELLANAERVGRKRGTRAGVELALRLGFPGLDLRVQDLGGVVFGADADAPTLQPFPGFVVSCSTPLSAERRAAVEWAIERQRPLHVNVDYRLAVAEESVEAPS